MGVWGPGVLDSDKASDCIGEICRQLIWAVDDRLQSLSTSSAADEEGLAFISLLNATLAGIRKARFNLSKIRAARWKATYMDWFESEWKEHMDPLDFQEFYEHRRRLLDTSFDLAEGDEDMDSTMEETKVALQIKL